MTQHAKELLDNMDADQLKDQIRRTRDEEIRAYCFERLDSLVKCSPMAENGEVTVGELQ